MYNEQPDYLDEVTGQSILHQQLNTMALYGATPPKGETDHRFLPDEDMIRGVVEEMFTNIAHVFEGTRLEAECDDVHWNIVNIFHHKITRLERVFDQLNFQIRALCREQDGSEIKALELEQVTEDSQQLSDTIAFFETIRDHAVELYAGHTGQCWIPAQGSRTTSNVMNGAVLDARQHLKAKAQAAQQKLNPDGDKILIAGGQDYTDQDKVFQVLDKTLAKHPDMILIHGGSPRGVDHIAAKWASAKNITQIICKPDWKQGKRSRVEQIVDWAGEDFDGIVAFDESHAMANAGGIKGSRGDKACSQQALAGLKLQRALHEARVVYVSATGATEVGNLAYAERLGLWGKDTAFTHRSHFVSQIEKGGIAPLQASLENMDNAADNTALIHTRHTMRQGKVWLNFPELRFR